MIFRTAVMYYLARRPQRRGTRQDMLQTMLVYALEHPDTSLNMTIVYLRALDILDPRCGTGTARERVSVCDEPVGKLDVNMLMESLEALDKVEKYEVPSNVPVKGEIRAMLLLIGVYGYTAREIATLWGVSESRVSQMLREWKTTHNPSLSLDKDKSCLQ